MRFHRSDFEALIFSAKALMVGFVFDRASILFKARSNKAARADEREEQGQHRFLHCRHQRCLRIK
jgi:hypothetical protein